MVSSYSTSSKKSSLDAVEEKISYRVAAADEEDGRDDASGDKEFVDLQSGHVDDAMKLADEAKKITVTPEEDRKLVWKLDLVMFPLICFIYAIQYMDKIATGSAAIMGLRQDLHMHGDQYSWVGSAFYFGYLFMNLGPVQLIFQKTKHMSKLLALFIGSWGLILCCHAAPRINYAAFIALRVLLGCAEGVVTPCFTIITAQYWKSNEQFTRICFWFGMNGLGVIMLNSMAYGLVLHKDSYSIPAWKLLFVIIGVITIALGALVWYWIPDDPSKARFLNEREKLMVVQRIRSNQQGFGNHQVKKYQIIEALKDPRTWMYFWYSVAVQIPNGGITNFMSILLNTDFGYSTTDSLLMGLIPGAIELVSSPLFGILSDYFGKKKVKILSYKLTWAIFCAVIALIGNCMLAYAKDNKKARLAGVYLWYLIPTSFICVLSNISANAAGYTKKWTVSSINLVAYAAANIAGPQCFIAKQAPNYSGAKTSMVVCYAYCVAALIVLLLFNIMENKRRDKLQEERGPQKIENVEFADLTDFENLNFRYTL
ncbi:allantoate permease family MFS transporter KNAG_0M00710 [Huiozyma naganishii CBS 8797]|uniref:Major facilitator superfamily (MFS) profile domain-containing protein n=1 Tax=Huiozyma naganishii (strain ATCC MYA-139 / BCRC 22969 / CBS 8797 / KCTC 17520 / NBRC 10181 / NCYC 3082 / Yp74L-3) TaxID=1071383 RepID=J7SAP6_HUIN7|nr:hypothetical protein KNAG_0M00710 [Kazachstania naganishii CBS 8797]CCK72924.1 hypothetical protein KNAG_0M00710 [Kazachstania naganishii CBS 8797]